MIALSCDFLPDPDWLCRVFRSVDWSGGSACNLTLLGSKPANCRSLYIGPVSGVYRGVVLGGRTAWTTDHVTTDHVTPLT